MIESGGVASSMSANSFVLKSGRSGPFSWTKSASDNASFMSAVKLSRSREAPGEQSDGRQRRPSLVNVLAQIHFRIRRRVGRDHVEPARQILGRPAGADNTGADDSDACEWACCRTCSILLQTAGADFRVGDAGEVALSDEEVALVRPIEVGGVDRAGEVGDEHPVAAERRARCRCPPSGA